jgi:hypothetical protein
MVDSGVSRLRNPRLEEVPLTAERRWLSERNRVGGVTPASTAPAIASIAASTESDTAGETRDTAGSGDCDELATLCVGIVIRRHSIPISKSYLINLLLGY